MYLLKLALRPWRLAPMSQLFAAGAVACLLFLLGFVMWMEKALNPVIYRLENEQVITAFLDSGLAPSEQGQVADKIRTSLGAKQQKFDVEVGAQSHFIEKLQTHYPALARELQELGPESDTMIPKFVTVSGFLPSDAVDTIRGVQGVDGVESSKEHYHYMVSAFTALRWLSKLMAIGLFLALVTGIFHLSRVNSHLQADALGVLRQWGAGEWTIRVPGAISGFWVGMLGGAQALLIWTFFGSSLSEKIRLLSPALQDLKSPAFSSGLILLALGALSGLLSGAIGVQVSTK